MIRPADIRRLTSRDGQEFVRVRLAIIRDPHASPADKLKAMEGLETRALGRPKEHVEVSTPELPEDLQAIRDMPLQERIALLRSMREQNLH